MGERRLSENQLFADESAIKSVGGGSLNEISASVPSETGLLLHRAWVDWAGMIASIGCAIHCAAMPLVLAYLPALGLSWLADEVFHKWMAAICFGLAAVAFVPGWRRHGSFLPAVWGTAGLLLLTTSAFALEESCCLSCVTNEAAASPATDLECTLCQSDGTTGPEEDSNFEVPFLSFVTPLGGLLLVVGHIVNHVKSCRCQGTNCCLTAGVDTEA